MLSPVISRGVSTFGVRRLSAVSNPPEGRIIVLLKAYQDHGNDINSELYDIVTLAGYSGREGNWPEFERRWLSEVGEAWAQCRNMPNVQPYIHVTDMLAGNDPFRGDCGWSAEHINSVLTKCALHLADATKSGMFRGVACSVLLKEYKQVRREMKLPSVEDICASFCAARSFAWSPDFADEFMREGAELYFDRNCPFSGSIVNRQRHGKLRNNAAWLKLVSGGFVDSKLVPGVQAADLLAWSIDSYHENKRPPGASTWQLMMVALERENLFLGEHSLRNPIKDELDELLALRLSNRSFR